MGGKRKRKKKNNQKDKDNENQPKEFTEEQKQALANLYEAFAGGVFDQEAIDDIFLEFNCDANEAMEKLIELS